jgi:hypothetical protein
VDVGAALLADGQAAEAGDPRQGTLNGVIKNDKLCPTRMGQLQLSWPRARGRLRAAAAAHLARPGLDRLRDAAKGREVDRVLVTAPDRRARNDVHQRVLLAA